MIRINGKEPGAVYVGRKAVAALYHGAVLIWQSVKDWWCGADAWRGTDAW